MGKIINVSEAAALGLHAMVYLASNAGEPASVVVIAEHLGASAHHLSKVMQRLAKAGFVRSIRGPAGGFVLAKALDEVTLLAVYEAIDGKLQERACLFDLPVCDGTSCVLGALLRDVNDQMRAHLSETTLADLQAALGSKKAS